MHKYLVLIGNRELEIQAPNIDAAQRTAMEKYPGEFFKGISYLGAVQETEEPEEVEPETDGEPDE